MSLNTPLKRLQELFDRIDIGNESNSQGQHSLEKSDQLASYVIWLDAEPMIPERTYTIKFESESTNVQITDLAFKVDINSLNHLAAKKLEKDEVGYCKLSLGKKVSFDTYRNNQKLGSFNVYDSLNNVILGFGLVDFELRRAQNISWQETNISQEIRSLNKEQKPCVIWFTGLSGSGKSTIADELEKKLYELGKHTMLLDGDNVRHGLNRDLGFTDQDRVENIRRIAEVSKLMVSSGLITLVAFISPFKSERAMARRLFNEGEFIEVYVDTPIEVCEARDSKGLYKKARAGKLKNFTGIDSDYEGPQVPEITLQNSDANLTKLVNQILDYLKAHSKI